jgi:REP element-mobilizing transposase RayT
MSRPLRLEHAGALWHVTSRGNEKRDIFRDDRDRSRFLSGLARVVEVCGWTLHAYVLMGNHYHLLVETPEPTLSRGMHRLNGFHTQKFNARHGRVGHLFQGRFKSILVEKETHLLELVRYIVLNPVRAGVARDAGAWRWSNYRATAGIALVPPFLHVAWTRSQFGTGAAALRRYREFVARGMGSRATPWEALRSQIFLGSEEFREQIQRMVGESDRSPEIPRAHRRLVRPGLDAILSAAEAEFGADRGTLLRKRRTSARLAVAYLAKRDALLGLAGFAPSLGVGVSAASTLARSAERLMELDSRFRDRISRMRSAICKMQT